MGTDQARREGRVILAINFNHDGSGVILVDGRIGAYVNTERFSRLKKHPGLREEELDELLAQADVALTDVDHVLLCNLHNMDSPDVPSLHGSDLKDTWFEFWVNQNNTLVEIRGHRIPCTVNPDHHLTHAASAYYTSPAETGVALAIDPIGCRAFLGQGNRLLPLLRNYDAWFNANIGYTSVAAYMFGSGIVGAGKVMGLAPYGVPERADDVEFGDVDTFEQLLALAEKNPKRIVVGDRELNATLAYYIQLGLERQVRAVFRDLSEVCARNGLDRTISYAGGTSLNAIANHKALLASDFERLHQHPACGDDGTSIGAALWYWHHVLGHERTTYAPADLMYSIRQYGPFDVRAALDQHAGQIQVTEVPDVANAAAELICDGAIVGWFDGASEVGPRALGHRSMLADPRDRGMVDRLNSRVKFREAFRPFAPSVLREHAAEWFDIDHSPFMLSAGRVRRSGAPAITHVDGTARIQTVDRADNPAYHRLIEAVHERTGIPLVLNTSLNTKGEPIVETPTDALRTLLSSEMDCLALPGMIVRKRGAA
ncbi:carbamoyltransferase C-terminal domain-containing protein [Micromonospora lutea]|uniref:Carbamoyltransferase n=1 Tax=Micromonospora lutea TaxID=419825 RepID=A0ABQ4IT19_9ACTN|nr:carbamoyltransferase C-terminal domain-containing protein [Micromonospora lutea]GIJ21067.1 carbamoyltransferase [Micromonospora lutea]